MHVFKWDYTYTQNKKKKELLSCKSFAAFRARGYTDLLRCLTDG